jgi:hypothetical protein
MTNRHARRGGRGATGRDGRALQDSKTRRPGGDRARRSRPSTSSVVGTDSAEPSARTCVFQTEPSFNCPERIEGSRDPASVATHSRGVLVLANDAPPIQGCPLSGTRPTVRALISIGRNWEAGASVGSVAMRDLAAARIDNWIRRRVIVSCCGTHPSQSKLNSARHRRLGLSAIGQSLKDQYDALATPIPPHLAALLKQLETQKRRLAGASRPDRAY